MAADYYYVCSLWFTFDRLQQERPNYATIDEGKK